MSGDVIVRGWEAAAGRTQPPLLPSLLQCGGGGGGGGRGEAGAESEAEAGAETGVEAEAEAEAEAGAEAEAEAEVGAEAGAVLPGSGLPGSKHSISTRRSSQEEAQEA